MLFEKISLIDENMNVRTEMYLGTQRERITYIDKKPPENPERFGRKYRENNKLLVPGFYNTHSHLSMILMRGYAENRSLMSWLNDCIFPLEAQLSPDDIYYACKLGIAELLRFGYVSASDMYINALSTCKAFAESGIKANVSSCCTGSGDVGYYDLPNYNETLAIRELYGENTRVKPEFSLHAEYTSTEKIAAEIAAAAKDNGGTMHVHVSETADEVEQCKSRHGGKTPVRYLADCGVFDVPTVAAHCVHITDDDIEILKKKNVTVATCPKSNLKLASGICPTAKLLEKGVNVALGTDSVASNNNLNMLEEMRFFSLLQKGSLADPTVISPKQMLYAATKAGAIAQCRYDCGQLSVGARADIAVFDIGRIYMHPTHDLLNNLVYSSTCNDVCMTMVDGDVLYENGRYFTLDIDELIYAVKNIVSRII